MNKEQHLFLKLGEEAIEVAHMSAKVMQFGMTEVQVGLNKHNVERLHGEMDDYQAMIEMLNDNHGLGYIPNRENIEAKKDKVRRYLDKSIQLGCVTND